MSLILPILLIAVVVGWLKINGIVHHARQKLLENKSK